MPATILKSTASSKTLLIIKFDTNSSRYPFYKKHLLELNSESTFLGLLTKGQADTSITRLNQDDVRLFEKAKTVADRTKDVAYSFSDPILSTQLRTPPPQPTSIRYLYFGTYRIKPWYTSPYPEEYSCAKNLYICESCLKYMNSDHVLQRHKVNNFLSKIIMLFAIA